MHAKLMLERMMERFDRALVAFGRHVAPADRIYWLYAAVAFVTAGIVGLLTDLWGLAGMTLASFSFVAATARKRYDVSGGRGG